MRFRPLAVILLFHVSVALCFAQATEFTYQGSLNDGSNPANANYDFEFALFDVGGVQLASTQTRSSVAVTNGIFTVSLDFGDQFPGTDRFLEIRVRSVGGGTFTTLAPRQPVNSAPYSIKSLNAENAVSATNATTAGTAVSFSGPLAGDVTGTQSATTISNNAVTTAKLADNAVTAIKIAGGQVVKNINGMTDGVTLAAGSNITLTPSGNTLTIASTLGPGTVVLNQTVQQPTSNFNISGMGTANILNAGMQFNIGGARVFSIAGS